LYKISKYAIIKIYKGGYFLIKYKNVEANNFLSYNHFKLDLDNQGLVLIEGLNNSDNSFKSNGSGKTSALSASHNM